MTNIGEYRMEVSVLEVVAMPARLVGFDCDCVVWGGLVLRSERVGSLHSLVA